MVSVAVVNFTNMRSSEDNEWIVDRKSEKVVDRAPLKFVNDHMDNFPTYLAYYREPPGATNDCAWSRTRRIISKATLLCIGKYNLDIVRRDYDEGDWQKFEELPLARKQTPRAEFTETNNIPPCIGRNFCRKHGWFYLCHVSSETPTQTETWSPRPPLLWHITSRPAIGDTANPEAVLHAIHAPY